MTMPIENYSTIENIDSSRTDRIVVAGLAIYFILSVVLRVAVSGTADMDETEHLIYTQALRLGYGSQLPLYAWMQHISFTLFGVNIFALSLLKYSLLFATYVCVYRIARKALYSQMSSVIAILSLFLIPQVVWESYRTLTNTVLATLLAAVTLLLMLRLREKPVTVNYLLLGAAAGLGMLSKYNYAIFLLALLIAGISTPVFRKCILSRKSFLTLAAMMLIAAPPYLWIAANLDRATASSKKLKVLDSGSWLGDTLVGFASLLASWIGYFWPALVVYGLFYFFTKQVRTTSPDPDIHQILKRTLVAAFTICSFLVLFFKITYFKERWMQPLLFFLPVYFMYHLGSRIDRKRFRLLAAAALVPALLAMLGFSGSVLMAARTGKATRLSPPYREMAQHVRNEGFDGGTILTNDHRIGGNFRLHFKDSDIIVPGMMEVPVQSQDEILVVWNADRSKTPPEVLLKYAEDKLGAGLDGAGIRYVEKPMLYWEGKMMKLGYLLIEGR